MSRSRFVQTVGPYGLYLAWLASVVALLGSLYFSEIMGFVPCELCWLQRICMYPLAVILGIASFRGDRKVVIYALPFSIIGGLIAFYHVLLQHIPRISEILPCSGGVPCNVDYINWLGFITIPLLALTAFVVITISLWISSRMEE